MSAAPLQVVAGILRDAQGRVLIAQRPEGKFMAGWWEFPGGKLADGESEPQALARELAEELGVTVLGSQLLMRFDHAWQRPPVQLAVYVVDGYRGEPSGLEGQALKWVSCKDLPAEPLLPADLPIVEHLLQHTR